MNYYEPSAITPVCTRCGWHIVGILCYIGDDGPLCVKCHDTSDAPKHVWLADEGEHGWNEARVEGDGVRYIRASDHAAEAAAKKYEAPEVTMQRVKEAVNRVRERTNDA